MSESSSFSKSNLTRSFGSFMKSAPLQIQSFAEFQNSRTERFNDFTEDLQAQKEKKKRELYEQLQELTLQTNTAQAVLAADEREFLHRQQELITELNKIKINAEIKAEESRMNHLNKLETLKNQHKQAISNLTNQIHQAYQEKSIIQTQGNDPRLNETKRKLEQSQNSLKQLKSSKLSFEDDENEHDMQYYANKISELEAIRSQVIEEYKLNQESHKSKTIELTVSLEDQDVTYQKEINNIKNIMTRKEEQYQEQLERCFSQIEQIQKRKEVALSQRRERIAKIQNEIKEIQDEFHQKMRDATRIAEKLKASLMNVNLRKTQQLQVEKDASNEQQYLIRENYNLQKQLYQAQKQLAKYKEEFSIVRRDLSAAIGPRRTSTLFY